MRQGQAPDRKELQRHLLVALEQQKLQRNRLEQAMVFQTNSCSADWHQKGFPWRELAAGHRTRRQWWVPEQVRQTVPQQLEPELQTIHQQGEQVRQRVRREPEPGQHQMHSERVRQRVHWQPEPEHQMR